MAGHAGGHSIQPGADLVRHLVAPGHDDGERAGPEGFGQLSGPLRHPAYQTVQHFHPIDVNNQRIILRATLGLEDLFDGIAVEGAGGDAIHRFGGNRHDFTLFQKLRRFGDGGFVCFFQ